MRVPPEWLARLGELDVIAEEIRANLETLERERAALKLRIAVQRAIPETPAEPDKESP